MLGRLTFALLAGLLTLSATAKDNFWKPHAEASYYYDSPDFIMLGDPGSSDPWVQQMRNFRDVLRVDEFREDPTPTPTPAPPPDPNTPLTFTLKPSSFFNGTDFDRTPPHPLADYFSDVADLYKDAGYGKIAQPLRDAGGVVEDLITRRRPNRFRAARALAQRIESAVRSTSDQPAINDAAGMSYAYYSPSDTRQKSYLWDDYRAVALNFAKGLRRAAKNATTERPLARGLPYLPQELTLQLIATSYWNYTGELVELVRTDGLGGSTTITLSTPTYNGSGGSGATLGSATLNRVGASYLFDFNGSSTSLSSIDINGDTEETTTPPFTISASGNGLQLSYTVETSPTPTPSPTP